MIKKVGIHIKKNAFIYGIGGLFGVGVIQSQGWVDFEPISKQTGLGIDYLMGLKDQVLVWVATGYGVFRTAKAVAMPAVVDYQRAKEVVSDRETIALACETRAKEELTLATNKQVELDKAKFDAIVKQNSLLEQIRNDQKSLPSLIDILKLKVEETKELIEDTPEEL